MIHELVSSNTGMPKHLFIIIIIILSAKSGLNHSRCFLSFENMGNHCTGSSIPLLALPYTCLLFRPKPHIAFPPIAIAGRVELDDL